MTNPASNKKPETSKKKDFGERLTDVDAIIKALPTDAQRGVADARKAYIIASHGGNPAKMRTAMEELEKVVAQAKQNAPKREQNPRNTTPRS